MVTEYSPENGEEKRERIKHPFMAALYSLGDHRLLLNYSEKLRVNLVCSKAPQEDHLLEARGKRHTHGFGPQATLCFITASGSILFATMVTLQFSNIIPVSLS